MHRDRKPLLGGLWSAIAGIVTATGDGESRRAALTRLRASLWRRGGVSAFAGTPCASEDRTDPGRSSRAAAEAGPEGS